MNKGSLLFLFTFPTSGASTEAKVLTSATRHSTCAVYDTFCHVMALAMDASENDTCHRTSMSLSLLTFFFEAWAANVQNMNGSACRNMTRTPFLQNPICGFLNFGKITHWCLKVHAIAQFEPLKRKWQSLSNASN